MVRGGPQDFTGVYEGQVLAGKYRVERLLGVGGMGAVFAAHHVQLDERVALKLLLPASLANAEWVARFAREARAAVKIKGDHVARVLDVGTLDDGAPYIVMEYLDGADLASMLQADGPLPFERAVDFVLQAMEAIAEAHSLGIVHRDLKPANLFCVRRADGRQHVKVLDFGISKLTGGGSTADLAVTNAAAVLGSPFYMSPEQLEASSTVDARTDVWALGVVLFELATGRVPFPGETVSEVSFRIASRPPTPLRELRPDAPEGLQAALARCLEKDRERRYADVGELARALAPFAPRRSRASIERIGDIVRRARLPGADVAPPSSVGPASQPAASASTIPPLGRTAGRTGGGRTAVGWMAVGVVSAATLVAAALVVHRVGTRSAAPPPVSGSSAAAALPPVVLAPAPPLATRLAQPLAPPAKVAAEDDASRPAGVAHTTSVPSPPAPPRPAPDTSSRIVRPAVTGRSCDPNYEIDPLSGAHKFKPWCFAGPVK